MKLNVKAIISDFDGVIISSKSIEFESWKRVFRENSLNLSIESWLKLIDVKDGVYDPIELFIERLKKRKKEIEIDEIRVRQSEVYEAMVSLLKARPGVQNFFRRIKKEKLKVGLASNSLNEKTKRALKRLGIYDFFDVVKCRDDVNGIRKPQPDVYLEVLKNLSLEASDVVAIEDSPIGIKAAKNAGIYCIAVPNRITEHFDLSEADMKVSSIMDIIGILFCK